MWKRVYIWKAFILVLFATDITAFKISKPLSREQIYLDVLKNITRVNNILNDLLLNYKHLKAIYEAQAKPENDLSVEIIDNENRNKNNKTDYDNDQEYQPVTQMILSDESFVEDNSDKSNENINIKPIYQSQITDSIKLGSNNQFKTIDKGVIKSKKDITDLIETDTIQNDFTNTKSPIKLSTKPELVIIGTALRYANNIPTVNKEKYKKPTLRAGHYNIDKSDYSRYKYTSMKQEIKQDSDEEVLFDQNLLNEKTSLGSDLNKNNLLVFVVNKKQKERLLKNSLHETDSDNREDEKIKKDQLENKILRDAYGSACLKVAVRKCYKTLVQVRKLICSTDYKCKGSFKEHFNTHSKDGCMAEFNYKRDIDGNQNQPRYIKKKAIKTNDRKDTDTTRGGANGDYYNLCLPVMMTEEMNKFKSITPKNKSQNSNRTEPINALRDDYEKECQRISMEKCVRACNYAVTNTCGRSEYVCERDERKSFTYTCRQECKYAFAGGDSDSDDESEDDSYDDSDDESDDDNDESDDDNDESNGDSMSFE